MLLLRLTITVRCKRDAVGSIWWWWWWCCELCSSSSGCWKRSQICLSDLSICLLHWQGGGWLFGDQFCCVWCAEGLSPCWEGMGSFWDVKAQSISGSRNAFIPKATGQKFGDCFLEHLLGDSGLGNFSRILIVKTGLEHHHTCSFLRGGILFYNVR